MVGMKGAEMNNQKLIIDLDPMTGEEILIDPTLLPRRVYQWHKSNSIIRRRMCDDCLRTHDPRFDPKERLTETEKYTFKMVDHPDEWHTHSKPCEICNRTKAEYEDEEF